MGACQLKGCGVDLIEVHCIAKALKRQRFRDQILHAQRAGRAQRQRCGVWAARFAAKEVVMKALGRGFRQGVPFASVEISSDCCVRSQVRLLDPAAGSS